MHSSKVSDLPIIEEDEATGDVARIYADVKRDLQLPIVPNHLKVLAVSPAALTMYWDFMRSFYQNTTLPDSLTSMILFAIAERANCQYCSTSHELTCRTLGVDEETLRSLADDLGHVSPQRVQAVVEFAVKVAEDPQGLAAEDYERVREQGVSDEELMEIILIAGIGKLNDTLADAVKIEVDDTVIKALGR